MAVAQQGADEPQVDAGEHQVHADHRPDTEQGVEHDEHHAAHGVEHAEAQHPRLQQRVDQQRGAGPAQRVEPAHRAHAVVFSGSGAPYQCSIRRREIEIEGDTSSSPASMSARIDVRSYQRASAISPSCRTTSVVSACAVKPSIRLDGNGQGWLPR